MLPLSFAVSLALKVDECGIPEACKNRRKEFESVFYDVAEKFDFFPLGSADKLQFVGVISQTADELKMHCGEHTLAQHFDAAFPSIKRMQGLPVVKAYSDITYRVYYPIEEIAISLKMDRYLEMDSLVDVLSDFFWTSPKWLGKRLVDYRNWQAASILLANLKMRTMHLEYNKKVEFGYLDLRGSSLLPAYNGYLGVTVRQHFYSRHRVELRHPFLPCVAVNGPYGHKDFYPLEVLRVVKN